MIGRINLVARLLKWMIAVDIFLCVLLYLPDQVREFYRITASTTVFGTIAMVLWIAAIGAVIWVSSNQIVIEAEGQLSDPSMRTKSALRFVPVLMGVLPIWVASWAQLESIPEIPRAAESVLKVGSIVRIQASEIAQSAYRLRLAGGALFCAGLVLMLLTWLIGGRIKRVGAAANVSYFAKPITLFVTAAMIIIAAALFVLNPVKLPQALNVFGIIAIFTLCICSFVVHITLIADKTKIAIVPLMLLVCGIFAALGINDNHGIRTLDDRAPTALKDVSDELITWLGRPDRVAFAKKSGSATYPIFIVAAQGGGAYAAYNAAAFLARMQDLCPNFRHHLFAISAVSGGSIGAASFAAALASEDEAGRTEGLEQIRSDDANVSHEACPQVTKFLARERAIDDLGKPGNLERSVGRLLRSDLLSPLVAATLFPDFTQTFLPWPVPAFDRARALEYALEASGQDIVDVKPDGSKPAGLLEQNYLEHWDATRSSPALLFNTTDAGTGKRVVISPFQLTDTQKFRDEVCLLAHSSETEKTEIDGGATIRGSPTLTGVNLRVSTAAFISARFPWVTPAATVRVNNPCFGKHETVRLVDGGYLDNSGVESALNLIDRMKQAIKTARARGIALPEIGIHLISLTGGDFPTRSSYAFNDILEPIRALLSGRESRAYIALNRARTNMSLNLDPTAESFARTDLQSMFYRLPLGWSLSQRTRNIISHESGRYWDCEPAIDYSQTRDYLNNSDCVQMRANFLLKGALPEAMKGLKKAEKYKADFNSQPPQKLKPEVLLSCYEEWWDGKQKARWDARNVNSVRERLTSSLNYQPQYFSYYQAEQVRDLLKEWDELGDRENDRRMLAYILAALSHDTQEFRRAAEFLSFESLSSLNRIWGARMDKIDKANQERKPPEPLIDRVALLNQPQKVAAIVWKDGFGNRDGEAWTYRSRGMFQIIGREQYARFGRLIGYNLIENPDALDNRRASARVAFAHYLSWANRSSGKKYADFLKQSPPDWRGARLNDEEGSKEYPGAIAERSDMFMGCIERASSNVATTRN